MLRILQRGKRESSINRNSRGVIVLLLIVDKCDFTCGSVYTQPLTGFDPLGSQMHPNHSRDAKFPGHHRAVGHHPADLHNEPASGQKERCPGRVGSRANQDFARG